MKIIKLVSGSPEWHAHRARIDARNASEASVMMGACKKTSRRELIRLKATGSSKEYSDWVINVLFERGHEVEAMARPIAEEIIGEELFPVIATTDDDYLGASFDGLTMLGDIAWECKQWNEAKAADVRNNILPEEDYWQVVQQLATSDAEKELYMVTDGTKEKTVWMWFQLSEGDRTKLMQAWRQFDVDLASYQHVEDAPKVVSGPVLDLPAVSVQVSGEIAIIDNLTAFGTALTDFVQKQLIREPKTDQDFADLDTQIKTLNKAEDALNQAEAAALAQVATIDQMKRTKDMLHKMARENRLMAEKLLEAKKASIRIEIKQEGELALKAHIDTLNKRLGGKVTLPAIAGNFAGVMSGKKTVKSLRDAVDAELANCKIKANELADRMDINLQSLRELAAGKEFLFMDAQAIVQKENGDLVNLIKARIAEHDAKEQARLDEQREQIRKEEEAKAAAKVRLEQIAEQAKKDQEEIEKGLAAAAELAEINAKIRDEIKADTMDRIAPALSGRVVSTAPQGSILKGEAKRVINVTIDGKPATHEQVALATGLMRPTDEHIINTLATAYGVGKKQVIEWLFDLDLTKLEEVA